ncbi:hypothetical protein Droror1_Dr00027648 [Drosera rotundifolia]
MAQQQQQQASQYPITQIHLQPLQPPYLLPAPLQPQPHHPHPYPYPYPYQHQSIYPHAPTQLPLTRQPPAKRTRDESSGPLDDPGAKRRRGGDVLFRVVVGSREIGKVIGKQGVRIQRVREVTKANVKIADALAPYEERVIIITSKSNEDEITDAEKALHQVAELILMDDGKPSEALAVTDAAAIGSTSYVLGIGGVSGVGSIGMNGSVGITDAVSGVHLVSNSIRLLIAGSQAGGLVGASGQNMEMLRNSSGASITLLPPNQLPYCASANESDRLVQVSGEVSAVLKAVDEIGCLLRLNPAKQVISISPAYNITSTRAVPHYVDPTAAEYVTLDMVISETMVGGLIGRSGSNISRIRNESGATIKVHGGKGEQKHRQIQLAGTAEQVALARQRVDEYIYSQLVQQADVQQ